MTIYLELTNKFNKNRLRTIISSGQAVVLHRVAMMSKDGDWIIREDEESVNHILSVLDSYKAHYRFSAPLDIKWLKHGWSSHFEFIYRNVRVRTDFVSRPPRISTTELAKLWQEQENNDIPFVDLRRLIELKKTNREKDYVVIGDLARRLNNIEDQLLYSRSARDLIALAEQHPEQVKHVQRHRPILMIISEGREKLEAALDVERRKMIHDNEQRLLMYGRVAEPWKNKWSKVENSISGLDLLQAHEIVVQGATDVLPFDPNPS